MDENKDIEESLEKTDSEQKLEEKKENPFKNPKFYLGFIVGLIPFLLFCATDGGYFEIILFFISGPYFFVGLIIWAVLKDKQRALAIGVLLAGITPVVILFLLMGGCVLSGSY